MDREILFRGKRLDNGRWIFATYGNHTSLDAMIIDRPHLTVDNDLAALGFLEEPDLATIGRYTGLTDKNGVKIFEGDIVRFQGKVYVIEYITKYARFAGINPEWIFAPFLLSNSEVIGNIHDNPELLEATS